MSTGLGSWYAGTEVLVNDEPVSTQVELPRRLSEMERALGHRPTVLFVNLTDHPGSTVLGNPYPRSVLLTALGVREDDWLPALASRLAPGAPAFGSSTVDRGTDWAELDGLDQLPVVRHRPGDVGPYVTAGVAVSSRPDGSAVNLGVYRIQMIGPREARIFLDPRTDGHRNLREWNDDGKPMPVSVFLGANPVHMLVAASRLAAGGNDYEVAANLLRHDVALTGTPPVPTEATHVVTGLVHARTAPEGPFGEFKGYYVDARMSNVLEVTGVRAVEGSAYPTIVAGAESGLTMMSMQNEYLMYSHLTEQGFPVRSVRYPLTARGEFLTLIETDVPTGELLAEAMAFDVRTKFVVCGPDLSSVWQSVATFGFQVRTSPYLRKGVVEGERVGLVLDIPPVGRPVEY